MKNSFLISQFRNLSFRAKLLISILTITSLSLLIFGYFFYLRAQGAQNVLANELQESVQQQSEQQLINLTLIEAQQDDQNLLTIANAMRDLAEYQAALYEQAEILSQGMYWDANEKLSRLPNRQYGNSATDISSVFIPNTVTLNDGLISDINLNAYLDFSAPAILTSYPDAVGLYFIGDENYTIYYPNIDLANIVPPNFDARAELFYTIASPENNPDKASVWTPPYQDPAGTGLIVTSSIPVYDNRGRFYGVLGVDISLAKINERVLSISVGESGFAFMIDPQGRIISMPQAGYDLFDLQPEIVPVGETPQTTLLGQGSQDFQNVTAKMTNGEQGLEIATVRENEYYIAFAPLSTAGYSLGLIAPVEELNQPYLLARETIENEAQETLTLALTILIAVLVAVAVFSFIFSQSFSQPLIELTKVAAQISSGNLSARAVVNTNDEIGTLAKTFNNMSGQLQESFSSLEARVEERTQALATVAEVGTATATILETERLLQEVVELTKERFKLYHSHIYLLDEVGENLVLAAGAGEPGRIMVAEKRSIPLEREHSLVARAARERKGVTVNDVTQEADFLSNPLLPDTRSELAVPMVVGSSLIGVFDIQSEQVGRFTESDINIQTTLAAQVATSIQNVRQFERSKAQAELESQVNLIGQRIQRATSVEDTLQIAIRELGTALGATRVRAQIGLDTSPADEANQN